jgi:hypothetical protein
MDAAVCTGCGAVARLEIAARCTAGSETGSAARAAMAPPVKACCGTTVTKRRLANWPCATEPLGVTARPAASLTALALTARR